MHLTKTHCLGVFSEDTCFAKGTWFIFKATETVLVCLSIQLPASPTLNHIPLHIPDWLKRLEELNFCDL